MTSTTTAAGHHAARFLTVRAVDARVARKKNIPIEGHCSRAPLVSISRLVAIFPPRLTAAVGLPSSTAVT